MSSETTRSAGHLTARFQKAYGRPQEGAWHAPGSVNLIGDGIGDDGLTLPFALAQGVLVAAARRDDGVLALRSPHSPGEAVVRLDALTPGAHKGLPGHAAGVAWALRAAGHPVCGASLLIHSELPQEAGIASSAALECAIALALCDLSGLEIPRPELVRLTQRAERDFIGVRSGGQRGQHGQHGQSAALLCTAGHALLLDHRSGQSGQVPLDLGDLALMIVDTRAAHGPIEGRHAARRAECERAAAALKVPTLRDVRNLTAALAALDDPVLRRRAMHVVTENHRVEATAGLLRAGAGAEIGALLTASHLSLRDQFEVSWPAADVVVETAVQAGARGGRMMIGGDTADTDTDLASGGSVLVLVPSGLVGGVRDAVVTAFAARSWTAPAFLPAQPSRSAHRVY